MSGGPPQHKASPWATGIGLLVMLAVHWLAVKTTHLNAAATSFQICPWIPVRLAALLFKSSNRMGKFSLPKNKPSRLQEFSTQLMYREKRTMWHQKLLPHESIKKYPAGCSLWECVLTNRLSTQYLPNAIRGTKTQQWNRSSPLVMKLYTLAWIQCKEKQ